VNETWLLSLNASLQIVFSSLLGFVMLVPMQPWGKRLRLPVEPRALLAAHLDWLMLAFMQLGAAFVLERWPVPASAAVAWMLVFGGWVNPVTYVLRGLGVDAFVFAGSTKQRLSAALSGASATAILVAWLLIAFGLAARAPH
jgi:hypothetical protein